MTHTTLIDAPSLLAWLTQADGHRPPLLIVDCSADLLQADWGWQRYLESHIAGATWADLNSVLSGPIRPDCGGRHPLPDVQQLAQWLNAQGMSPATQVVVYDRNNCNFCVRLWWLLKHLGHEAVAVLDGGFMAWQDLGGPCNSGEEPGHTTSAPSDPTAAFQARAPLADWRRIDQVKAQLGQPTQSLIDARATARYLGHSEAIDPVAGHIPGALNRPFTDNFQANGLFKTPAQLHSEFIALLGHASAKHVVHYCGSGVSATVNVLAMELAGLGRQALYAGSWSEWCRAQR